MNLPLFRPQFIPTGEMRVPRNQSRAPFVGEIRPGPLHQHNNTITEPDQEKDMNEQPRQPGKKARNVNLAKLSYRCRAPNGCQIAFVEVVKVLTRLTTEVGGNIVSSGFALLHGYRRDPRQHLSVLVLERGQVSNHKDFRMPWQAQIRIHRHSPSPVHRPSELFPEG